MINTRWPGLHPPGLEGLQRGAAGDPDGGCLLERGVRRLVGEFVLPGRGVLGEGTPAHPEHLVTHGESGHRRTDRGDGAGHIDARAPGSSACGTRNR